MMQTIMNLMFNENTKKLNKNDLSTEGPVDNTKGK
jgi:hypothetical protein